MGYNLFDGKNGACGAVSAPLIYKGYEIQKSGIKLFVDGEAVESRETFTIIKRENGKTIIFDPVCKTLQQAKMRITTGKLEPHTIICGNRVYKRREN